MSPFSRSVVSGSAAGQPSVANSLSDVHFMQLALQLARRAEEEGEVPVGALVVLDGELLGEGWNRPIGGHDPTAHAEIVALRAAAQRQANYRLESATLYATLEPCVMCMGAALNARVSRVVFGAWDAKAGACGSVLDLPRVPRLTHRLDVFGGVLVEESAALLRKFFETRR
jgi:tRNA(adenine34) deaminase